MYMAALFAAALSALFTFLIRHVCLWRRWVASAVGDRLQHVPTPRLGGLGIVVAFFLVCAELNIWHDPHPRLHAILFGGLGVFALGLVDDIWQISARLKFVAQIGFSVVPVVFGVSVPLTHLKLLNAVITVLWFVGLTNAFNLLDNMNGLCAGIAIVVSLFRAAIALLQNDHVGFILCITLAGAVFGFLIFNFPKGLIFMGDCGALFLGFVLAGLAFTGRYAYLKSYLDLLLLPVVLMLVPLCDTTFVTIVRRLCGRPISMGGRDHLSHSLVATGLSPLAAVVTLWLVCAGSGAISLIGAVYGSARAITLLLILLAGVIATVSHLMRYQVVSSGGRDDIFDRVGASGIALTAVTDLLLTSAFYYAACVLTIGGVDQARSFFMRSVVAVVGVKLALMALLGCYPRLPTLRRERILRLLLANACGSLVAWLAILLAKTVTTVAMPIVDLVFSATSIIGLRWYSQRLETHSSLFTQVSEIESTVIDESEAAELIIS